MPPETRLLLNNDTKTHSKLTVEVPMFLYMVCTYISRTLEINMLLEKAYSSVSGSEIFVQTLVAEINGWKLAILTGLTVIVTLYCGALVDRSHKHKTIFLYLPIAGEIVTEMANCLNVYNWSWRLETAAAFQCLIPGITGSTICYLMLATTYLSQVSSQEDRTARIGHLYSAYAIGIGCGYGVSGYMLRYVGFTFSFIICMVINIIAIMVQFVLVKEVPSTVNDDGGNQLSECLSVLIKQREGNKRAIIALCLLCYPLIAGMRAGEGSVMYLYGRRKFGWNATDYSTYMVSRMTIILIGTLFCTNVLSRRFKLRDAIIGIIGCALDMTALYLQMIIIYSWQIYAVCVLNIFHMALSAVTSSIATKCVESHEYGKLNGLFGLTEIAIPFVYVLYNEVYKDTLSTLPTSVFFISMFMIFPPFVIFCVILAVQR